MTRYDLVIRGRVATEGGVIPDGWVGVSGEKIAAVGQGGTPDAVETVDAGKGYVLPGVIDGQTHAGSQFGFKGVEKTSMSAVAGGVTTMVDMPYDQPTPVHDLATLTDKAKTIDALSYCDVALYGTVLADPDPVDIRALVKGGVCAFKISSFENHPTRFPRIDNGAAMTLLKTVAPTGLPVGLHNEDQDLIKRLTAEFVAAGKTSGEFHNLSRPEEAELLATANFLELGRLSGARVHIVHISTPDGFAMVERFRREGVKATAEMCVHYLHFDEAVDMPRLGSLIKVNPPIRPHRKEALWTVLEEGGCTFVSSDHSAWALERKVKDSIFEAAAGVPGLEALLPVFFSDVAARKGEDAAAVACARALSAGPADFFGLSSKGRLAPGLDADIVVLDLDGYIYDAEEARDGLGWSPYHGERFAARPAATFLRGKKVFDGATVTGTPGDGRFVARG
ncbi:dihydroorotase [Rhizobium halophytocola]|uniref:Allantoinase n=1 Tax=Rhizobium halophytocola TaxID=735519 RepID=A0ABS4DU40_9HYPH|nr:amidohydrolase family protein [Rhizobium halophytocola]MBP1849211.1 allantoinase [Rhizobium halophytocola]